MGAGNTLKAQKNLLSLIDASEKQLQKYEHIVKQLDPAIHDEFYLKKRLSMLEVLMKGYESHVEKLLELLMDAKIQWNEILEGSFEFNERYSRVVAAFERFIAKHKSVITTHMKKVGKNLLLLACPISPLF